MGGIFIFFFFFKNPQISLSEGWFGQKALHRKLEKFKPLFAIILKNFLICNYEPGPNLQISLFKLQKNLLNSQP